MSDKARKVFHDVTATCLATATIVGWILCLLEGSGLSAVLLLPSAAVTVTACAKLMIYGE